MLSECDEWEKADCDAIPLAVFELLVGLRSRAPQRVLLQMAAWQRLGAVGVVMVVVVVGVGGGILTLSLLFRRVVLLKTKPLPIDKGTYEVRWV